MGPKKLTHTKYNKDHTHKNVITNFFNTTTNEQNSIYVEQQLDELPNTKIHIVQQSSKEKEEQTQCFRTTKMEIVALNVRGGQNHLNGDQLRNLFFTMKKHNTAVALLSEIRVDKGDFAKSYKKLQNLAINNGMKMIMNPQTRLGAPTPTKDNKTDRSDSQPCMGIGIKMPYGIRA